MNALNVPLLGLNTKHPLSVFTICALVPGGISVPGGVEALIVDEFPLSETFVPTGLLIVVVVPSGFVMTSGVKGSCVMEAVLGLVSLFNISEVIALFPAVPPAAIHVA